MKSRQCQIEATSSIHQPVPRLLISTCGCIEWFSTASCTRFTIQFCRASSSGGRSVLCRRINTYSSPSVPDEFQFPSSLGVLFLPPLLAILHSHPPYSYSQRDLILYQRNRRLIDRVEIFFWILSHSDFSWNNEKMHGMWGIWYIVSDLEKPIVGNFIIKRSESICLLVDEGISCHLNRWNQIGIAKNWSVLFPYLSFHLSLSLSLSDIFDLIWFYFISRSSHFLRKYFSVFLILFENMSLFVSFSYLVFPLEFFFSPLGCAATKSLDCIAVSF